jgi:hypothetical protein
MRTHSPLRALRVVGPRVATALRMLARVVQYLHSHDVPFRLLSSPAPEPLPLVAYRVPPGGIMVETCVLLVAGRPAVACMPRGAKVNLPRLEAELRATVIDGSAQHFSPPYTGAEGPIPPLGRALGATLTLVDETLEMFSPLAFAAFSPYDILEIPFDDFSRLERPRITAFAVGGELPERSSVEQAEPAGNPERKSA